MSRGTDALAKIKAEIDKDPTLKDLSPAEIAIKLSEPKSKVPPEFILVPRSVTSVISTKATPQKEEDLKTAAIEAGVAESKDFEPLQVEVFTRICDEISLGDISQGDVEQALLK